MKITPENVGVDHESDLTIPENIQVKLEVSSEGPLLEMLKFYLYFSSS